jgi:hypothetical protein
MLALFRIKIEAETVMEYDIYKFASGQFFARRRDREMDWSGSVLLKAVSFWQIDHQWITTNPDNDELVKLIGAQIENSETLVTNTDLKQIYISS